MSRRGQTLVGLAFCSATLLLAILYLNGPGQYGPSRAMASVAMALSIIAIVFLAHDLLRNDGDGP